MMNRMLQWFDDRTGYRAVVDDALYENIPGGARWRYVFGSTLVFAFVTQMITGLFLWAAYSPSSQTAWESVYYIQYEMQGGWLLRAVHHFMAQAMIVLLALHLLQVIIDGAYRAPREVNFWLGLILMKIVLGLSLTGYLLPWDQKGFWATNVATNLMTLVPVVGEDLQKLVVGGSQYGHHTLTRFFALHTGVLPGALVFFLVLHLALFRKHGIHAVNIGNRRDADFWPDQVLKDAVACLAVLAFVFLLVIHFDLPAMFRGELSAHHHGAELGAPADPANQYSAARPEWYFLSLFQLLKYFPGSLEIIGALVLPGVAMFILFIMPLTAKLKGGHAFNVVFAVAVVLALGGLTAAALQEDYYARLYEFDEQKFDPETQPEQYQAYAAPFDASNSYLEAAEAAERDRERIVELIQFQPTPDAPPQMIPRTGAVGLLRSDPLTQGPALFERSCLGCHSHYRLDAAIAEHDADYWGEREVSAPQLDRFADRAWIEGVLSPHRIQTAEYYGATVHKEGRMATWVGQHMGRFIRHAEISSGDLSDDERLAAVAKQLKLGERMDAAAFRAALEQALKDAESTVVEMEGAKLEIDPGPTAAWAMLNTHLEQPTAQDNGGDEASGDGESSEPKAGDDASSADGGEEEAAPPRRLLLTLKTTEFEDMVAALSAQAGRPDQAVADAQALQEGGIDRGVALIKANCTNGCHRLGDAGQIGLAPDLTGYGSWDWMMGIIGDPNHRRFYGPENDRMPAFGANIEKPAENQLTASQISMLADWLRGQYIDEHREVSVPPHSPVQAARGLAASRQLAAPSRPVLGEAPAEESLEQRATRLFTQNCAACHSKTDQHGAGVAAENPSAPNLHGFASRQWLSDLMVPEEIVSDQFFGDTIHVDGAMVEFVEGDVPELDDEGKQDLANAVIALSAEAALPSQQQADRQAADEGLIEAGREALVGGFVNYSCTDCHKFHDDGDLGEAPDLTGYGSVEWLAEFIADPAGERFYEGTNDRMPAFAGHGGGRLLGDDDILLLARWLRGEELTPETNEGAGTE